MKLNQLKQYFLYSFLISLAIGILIHLNMILNHLSIYLGTYSGSPSEVIGHGKFVMIFMTSFLIAFCTFTINFFLIKPLDRQTKMNTKSILLAVFVSIVSVYILSTLFYALRHKMVGREIHFDFNLVYFLKDIIMSAIIVAGLFSMNALFDRQYYSIENEKLNKEKLQSQIQALKNQISPHFLFNSLSALKTLINENQALAQTYLDNLADVLRATLQGSDQRTVSLAKELEFLKSYLYLIEMRYDTNFKVNIDIDSAYLTHELPYLTLQILVENAIKHNVISRKYPMEIRIFVKGDYLVVSNLVRPKQTAEPGTGTGLSNLIQQYKLLGTEEVQIAKSKVTFEVAVPLTESNK